MYLSQKAVLLAGANLGLDCEILHPDAITVRVAINGRYYYFTHWIKPFNTVDTVRLLKDKDLTYSLLANHIKIPDWEPFLDPHVDDFYPISPNSNNYKSVHDIAKRIEDVFGYPHIIKPNKGSTGKNVSKVTNMTELLASLNTVFEHGSQNYDYIAIAQEFIDIAHEYRILTFRGDILMMYEKDISNATYIGNLSPLHWENSKAVMINDITLQNKILEFIKPTWREIDIQFAGYDIAIDKGGDMRLIEINSNPGLKHLIDDNGIEPVVKMYEKIFTKIRDQI